MNEATGSDILDAAKVIHQYDKATQQLGSTDLALSFFHAAKEFYVLNKAELEEQMRTWRKLAKEGTVKMRAYNNKTQTARGRTWHFLVVQSYHPNGEMMECNVDPFGLFVLGELVNGFVYAFTREANRNMVYEYVMKDVSQPIAEDV